MNEEQENPAAAIVWGAFALIIAGLAAILLLAGCQTPPEIANAIFDGQGYNDQAHVAALENNTSATLEALDGERSIWNTLAEFYGEPVKPRTFTVEGAKSNVRVLQELAEQRQRMEVLINAMKSIGEKGLSGGIGLPELIAAFVAYFAASKGTNLLSNRKKT